MIDDLDKRLRRLADAPLPGGLDRLEADVLRRIASSRIETMISPSWRVSAVGIALIVGIGVGASSAVTPNGSPADLGHMLSGADLAPSSLLATS